ncbi:hypothetical protein [Homoserinibacter sp. GY 40078]|uniref:hypothetical protein n=1 Tax=Homoserinibacter sp. GY 40078 TaxID=2603275 RepID=UPI0011C6FA59|nr:hypothetical protein [Homoserinibacter sp. GY 40078]TXK16328.1 hypothetical protein FVQ89_13830 [Homoserinibacter sp. GY 40078]
MRDATTDPADPDDEALHWAGDEARGQAAPRLATASDADATAPDAQGEVSAAVTPAVRPTRSRAETAGLLATGIFAGLYLAVTVGWVISVQQLGYPGLDLAGEIMWQFAEFLAMVAPALWFLAVHTLTPEGTRHRGIKRVGWFALGLGVLVPWPFLLLGAFG